MEGDDVRNLPGRRHFRRNSRRRHSNFPWRLGATAVKQQRESIMTLPTKPHRRPESLPARLSQRPARWYKTVGNLVGQMRLISSGMPRSKLRSPASTWTDGTPFLTATSEHAKVELTSPTTRTQDG